MKNTTTWQLPYPEPGDHTRTWEYWQALAEKVDTQLTALQNRPVCVLEKTSVTASVSNTFLAMPFDVETSDNSGMHVAGNTSKLTATVAGLYQLIGGIGMPAIASGMARAQWWKGGTAIVSTMSIPFIAGTALWVPAISAVVRLNVGEYIELAAAQTSGTPVSINSGHIAAQLVGA